MQKNARRYLLPLACFASLAGLTFQACASDADPFSFDTSSAKPRVINSSSATNSAASFGVVQVSQLRQIDQQQSSAPVAAAPQSTADRATDLVIRALSLVGVNYRRGGNTPESGLDCSGFVRYVFHDSLGLNLPRRAEEISRVGEKIGKNELKPGDLVFYNTLRKTFSHVGIYLGDGQFVHAPSAGGEIRVENMNQPYWTKRFSGARRVADESSNQ